MLGPGSDAPPLLGPLDESKDDLLYDLAGRAASAAQELPGAATLGENLRSLPILGNIANSVDSSYEAVKRVGMQKADEVIAANAGQMIGSIGATMLNSLHDHAMPVKVHKFVDNT